MRDVLDEKTAQEVAEEHGRSEDNQLGGRGEGVQTVSPQDDFAVETLLPPAAHLLERWRVKRSQLEGFLFLIHGIVNSIGFVRGMYALLWYGTIFPC